MILCKCRAASAAAHAAVAVAWQNCKTAKLLRRTQSPQATETKKKKTKVVTAARFLASNTRVPLSHSLDKLVANVNVVGLKQKRRLVGQ